MTQCDLMAQQVTTPTGLKGKGEEQHTQHWLNTGALVDTYLLQPGDSMLPVRARWPACPVAHLRWSALRHTEAAVRPHMPRSLLRFRAVGRQRGSQRPRQKSSGCAASSSKSSYD